MGIDPIPSKRKYQLLKICTLLIIGACASYTSVISRVRFSYMANQPEQALKLLEESNIRTSRRNRLLYYMEKAQILDKIGAKNKSRSLLIEADKLADNLYTTSILDKTASFFISDSAESYRGEIYERIAIHTILALSFLEENKLSSARVEAKKINNKLYALTMNLDPKHNNYVEDGFARYLSGIIYEAEGSIDDAIIDYKKALKIYESPQYKEFFYGQTESQIAKALYRLAKVRRRKDLIENLEESHPYVTSEKDPAQTMGELIVIHQVGHIAIKYPQEFSFNIGDQFVRMSFPVIPRQNIYPPQKTGLEMDGSFFEAQNTANLSAIARQILEDQRFNIVAKSTARLVLKAQMVHQARKEFGELGGIAANIMTAATETADTRCWSLLPGYFFVSRQFLPEGEHQLKIFNNGQILDIKRIQIKPGQLLILRS